MWSDDTIDDICRSAGSKVTKFKDFLQIFILKLNISHFRHMSASEITEKAALESGTKIATEAIANIRTVASLSKLFNVHLKLKHISSFQSIVLQAKSNI